MKKPFDKQYFLNFFGLISIGIFSLGYVLFIRPFAELNIQFPFLDFPVFVGEILLFICLLLFLVKCSNNPQRLTKWHYLMICYFVFVVIKALCGYWEWGPLALRHAALLYYPVFAVFGYVFYRRDLFSQKRCLILLFLILAVFGARYSGFWTLTLVSLGFILMKFYPNKITKFLLSLVFLIIIPYKEFFQTSRMMIVSNFLSGLYSASILPIILNVNRRLKFGLMMLIGGIVVSGLFIFADHGAVKSIIAFKKMAEVIRACDAYIETNGDHFKMEERKEVKLYNPNKPVRNDTETIINGDKKATETAEGQVRAELKKAIVKDVKEKIAGFSLGQVDKKAQEEVKQEIESILAMQLPAEVEGDSAGLISAGTLQVKDKALENRVKYVKKEAELVIVTPASDVTQEPWAELVETAKIAVQDKAQGSDAEEANTIIRQTFFEQVKQEIRMASVKNILNGEKHQNTAMIDDVKREMQMAFTEQVKQNVPLVPVKESETGWVDHNNAVFRILIWRDMWRDLVREKPILGFSFGRPFRSRSLEMLHWGDGDWARDGWIEPHNSYLHIIYRTGIVGILLIFSFLFILFKMIKHFILIKSITGILLCGIIINWFAAANFLVIFELPYTAIPIWTIYGMTFAYCYKTREIDCKEKTAL